MHLSSLSKCGIICTKNRYASLTIFLNEHIFLCLILFDLEMVAVTFVGGRSVPDFRSSCHSKKIVSSPLSLIFDILIFDLLSFIFYHRGFCDIDLLLNLEFTSYQMPLTFQLYCSQ